MFPKGGYVPIGWVGTLPAPSRSDSTRLGYLWNRSILSGCDCLLSSLSCRPAGPVIPAHSLLRHEGAPGDTATLADTPFPVGMPFPATLPPVSTNTIPGLALIPSKLIRKILQGEYIEMKELPPESWRLEEARDSCCRASHPAQGGLITDISLWTECYASLVAVLTTKYPQKAL